MYFTDVSFSRLAEVFTSALREGIAHMFTEAYQTNDGYTMFIEPLEKRLEVTVDGKSAIRLIYTNNNKTWNEAEFGTFYATGPTALKAEKIMNIYERVRVEKNIFYSSYKTS